MTALSDSDGASDGASNGASDGVLAGYRLVRKLAVGSRADVYLGVGSTGTVALKLFAPDTSRESIGAELDALGRLESPHLVRLLDVSSASGEPPILVLERVTQGSVADLLSQREGLECGEVVTVLAPIAALVAELHDAGVAHGRIGLRAVHLGSKGEPILLGLGHCALFTPGGSMAAIDKEPAAAADRDALAAFAIGILSNVRSHADEARVRDLTNWIQGAPRAYEFPGELAERLFACAEPLPVTFTRGRSLAATVPARLDHAHNHDHAAPAEDRATFDPPAASRATIDPSAASGQPGWINVMLENPVEFVRGRAASFMRGVRPRYWVIVAAATLGLILAVALIPSTDATHTASDAPAAAQPAATSTTLATTPAATPVRNPGTTATPVPEDPLLAAKLLLAARAGCLHDLSILCLDNVDQVSSAAFSSDAAQIELVQQGGETAKPVLAEDAQLVLIERLGDTALIGTTSQGTPDGPSPMILVIRSKAGWRIRDYVSGAQATPSP